MANKPCSRRTASKRANSFSIAPARTSRSRNSQIVVASGTGSCSARPTKRMNESLSLSWYSVCSSERV